MNCAIQLRKINSASFPVQYNESFYQDVLKRNNDNLNKFAYYKGFVVGAVCARVEERRSKEEDDESQDQRLYIMTLAVLAAYRGRNIGSQLLQSILKYCKGLPMLKEIALHVQISNTGAIRFYTEKFGFTQGDMVENYYRRIEPPHCYLLYKQLDPQTATESSSDSPDVEVKQQEDL